MLRSLIVCSLLLACSAFEAADPEKPPFNKEELEEILRKDHSDRISNIYDSANDIQCARRPPGHRTSSVATRPRLSAVSLRRLQVHLGRG
jgi:hypothetical protein